MTRKLASIRRIADIQPIDGADPSFSFKTISNQFLLKGGD
jgi:hypothetical protein